MEFCYPFPLYVVVATEQLKRTCIVLIAARYSSAKVTCPIEPGQVVSRCYCVGSLNEGWGCDLCYLDNTMGDLWD